MKNEKKNEPVQATEQPLQSEVAYWKGVAQDAISANETARKDVENLKQQCKELQYKIDGMKYQNENTRTHKEYEMPSFRELVRGVRPGGYDMTISISLFRGDKNGTTYGCGYEEDD